MTVETGLCYAQWVNFKLLQFAALQAMFTFGLVSSSSSLSLPESTVTLSHEDTQ